MSAVGISVIGAGSMRCAPAIVGSLASYFGERQLEVCFYDADPERLELFRRLASVCFALTKTTHILMSTCDPSEALLGADRVILAADENCAAKFAKANPDKVDPSLKPDERLELALPHILSDMPEEAVLLSLLGPEVKIPLREYFRMDWPEPLTEEESRELAHQVLRWVRSDDYMHGFVAQYERSPFKTWLDDVFSATIINEG